MHDKIHIRKATPNDLADMQRIYCVARQEMKVSGNPSQWGDDWPPPFLIESYTKKDGFVVVDGGKVVAVFSLTKNADDLSYKTIDGKWLNDLAYGAIHTLASDGTAKGITKLVLDFCLTECGNIKVDTHANNAKMLHILKKENFTYCGKINIVSNEYKGDLERLAYQKTA